MRRCTNCRLAHLKCDFVRPACESCQLKGKKCIYRSDVEGKGQKKAPRIRGPPTQTKALLKQTPENICLSEKDLLTPQVEVLLSEYPESKLLNAIHASITSHLQYSGQVDYFYKFEPSVLLAFGMITQEFLDESVNDLNDKFEKSEEEEKKIYGNDCEETEENQNEI